jgi:hypothetical protein
MTVIVDWVTSSLNSIAPGWAGQATGAPRSDGGFGAAAVAPPLSPAWPGAIPGKALGGPVRAGRMYRWQEEGTELFMPRTDGTVISNRQLRAMRGQGGGRAAPAFHIGAINVHAAPGQSERDVARAVRRELEQMARAPALHDGGFHGD